MKKIVVILIFIFVTNMCAQTDSIKIEEENNSLKEGKWAMLFQVGQNFTLNPFQGADGFTKYHFSDKTALRIGCGLSFNTTLNDISNNETRNGYGITLRSQYLWYNSPKSEIIFFYGGGPDVNYSYSNIIQKVNTALMIFTYNYKYYNFGIAISAVLGVEYFITPSMSFFAEYDNVITYSSNTSIRITTNDLNPTVQEQKFKNSGISIGSSEVKVGLAAYFDFN